MSFRRQRRGAPISDGARARRHRLIGALAIIGVLLPGAIAVGSQAAFAVDYPTWSDVANARSSEAAANAEIKRIQGLLAGLRAEAERTAAEAQAKSVIFQEADQKFQEAALKAENLQQQADEARAKADSSVLQAGQMAARLAKSGNADITASLFSNASKADGLLQGLEMASKVSQQAEAIYSKAFQASNTAQSLTDQADVAKAELEVLKVAAEQAFAVARDASNAAAAALDEQLTRETELEAQIAFLRDLTMSIEAGYLAGVRERIAAGASLDAGEISLSGWARPASGRITDPYGFRVHPIIGGWRLHTGTDIEAGCGQNVYAASSGVVSYAGPNGTYGNFIEIDHGNGVSTGYAHISPGGILVSHGQTIGVGTNIAKVGSTGYSTGCHLHFEVRLDGVAKDPVPFMANEGITLGTSG